MGRWEADGCAKFISAVLPAWSPTADQVAFFASPDTLGLAGPERSDQPFNLYMMEPDTWRPRLLLEGVLYPNALQWSPDGRRLAFAGGMDGDEEGVWLFDPTSDKPQRVTNESVGNVVWSPDGRRLAGLYTPTADPDVSEVRLFELVSRAP